MANEKRAWKIDRYGASVSIRSPNWLESDSVGSIRFRMLDDDNEIYYEGRCTPATEFEPLDDFGRANAGCTSIQYREDGMWVDL